MSFRLRVAIKLVGLTIGLAALYALFVRLKGELDPAAVMPVLPVIALVVPWFVLPLAAATEAWRVLLTPDQRPGFLRAAWLSWVGLAVNWVLPVATVGGEVVKLVLGRRDGGSGAALAASLVVDKTLQVLTQIAFVLVGAVLIAIHTGELPWHWAGLAGFVALGAAVALFVRGQRAGMFGRLARTFKSGDGARLTESAARLDDELFAAWHRRSAVARGLALRFTFRLLLAGEVYLVLTWADQAPGLATILVLESVAQGARMSAFLVPAGIGVQEGALLAAGVALGVPIEVLVALALVKRLREIVVALPALAAWQWHEAKHTHRLARGDDPRG